MPSPTTDPCEEWRVTITLTTSLTIETDETYAFTDGPVFYMPSYPDDFSFRNYGTIHASGHDAVGFRGWTVKGEFLNAGLIRVDSTGGSSYGLYFESHGPDIVNTGRIELNGLGQAVRSWSPHQSFVNHGVVIASSFSGSTAMWFRNAAELSNFGEIRSIGHAATAIFIDNFHDSYEVAPTQFRHDGYFENNGSVVAEGDGITYALMLSGVDSAYGASGPNIVNNGLMQAERAIWWVDGAYYPRPNAEQWVVNNGQMYGDVYLGTGHDTFVSNRTYVGHIDMGEGDDFVDLTRSAGSATVAMDRGDDRVIGSAAVDYIDGGADDDHIEGGGGADRLLGDSGDDEIHGGAGNDTIRGGWDQDLIEGGDGNDILWGDEDLFPMAIFLSSRDRLHGGAGDDQLNGGQADDYLDGGEGTDTATYWGFRANYQIETVDGVTTIRGLTEGLDTLVDVERLQFFDGLYAITGELISRPVDTRPGDDVIHDNDDPARLSGGAGDDIFILRGGIDYVDGGSGYDIVRLSGSLQDYKMLRIGDAFLVTSWNSNSKYLLGVELVEFSNGDRLDLARHEAETGDEPLVLPGAEGLVDKLNGPEVSSIRWSAIQAPDGDRPEPAILTLKHAGWSDDPWG